MNCRNLYFLVFLICHCLITSAQQCSPTFQEILVIDGECTGNAVIYTPTDEVVVAGKLAHDAFILKTSPNGQIVWGHRLQHADTSILNNIKLSADGNYIALGTIAQQLWITKIDPSGNPIWNKLLPIGPDPVNAKEIIELSSGGYAIIANRNDSTSASDGIVARLDASGNPLWIKQFDGNGADGFNYIREVNGQLLISGYITGDLKDAFLMKLDPANGTPLKTTSYSRNPGWDEEGINISTISGGYSWGIKMTLTPTSGGYSSDALEIIKSDLNDNNFLVQQVPVGFGAIYPMKNLQVKPTALNDGFIFINNYPDNHEFPTIGKVENAGHKEWSRNYSPHWAYAGQDFNSIDLTANYGYVVTGRASFIGNNLLLMKTDLSGIAGSCANGSDGGDGGGSDHINGSAFTWASVNDQASIMTTPTISVDNLNITIFTNCTGQSCLTSPPVDNGDKCTTSMLSTTGDSYSNSMADAVRASDGDIITIGSRSYYWTYRSQLLKLKPGGNIRWGKQFDSKSTEDGYDVITKIIRTNDNNLVVSGYSQVTIDHSVYDSVFLMKINNAGDLLWSKRMAEIPYSVGNSFTAATPDGGFIMASNSGYGVDYNKVMKFNAAGDIVWQQQLQHVRWGKTIQALQYDNGSIYLCLDMYDYTQTRLEVVKLNAADGSYIWSRHFYPPASTLRVLGIESIQDSLYVGLSIDQTQTKVAVLKLDTKTGKQLSAFSLNVPIITSGAFTKTIDNNLIIAQDATINGTTGIFVNKFKPDGRHIWARHFTQLNKHSVSSLRQDGTGCIITGTHLKKNALNEAANEGFVMRLTSEGEIENASGDCVNQPVTVAPGSTTTIPLTMTEDATTVTGVAAATMNIMKKTITLFESPTLGYPSCASFNSCTNITVDGPEKICDLQQTYIYHATRSSACTTPLTWKLDPEYGSIISQSVNDVTIKFLKLGNTAVTALLDAGCQMIPAIKDVEIARPANDLDLGADLELCRGKSFTLDAGTGFAAYEWNDGSTHQQLIITTPGTYTVKVTDACNNEHTSDLIVTDGGNHPFSLGPDILKCAETSVTINLPAGFQNLSWNTAYNKTDLAAQAILFPALDTTYILFGTRGPGCSFSDTLKVKIIPPVSIGLPAPASVCQDQRIQLSIGSDFTNLSWTNGLSGYTAAVSTPGTYIASAIDVNGCVSKDTFELRSILPAPNIALSKETFICEGSEKILDAGNEGISYRWNTGETTRTITVHTVGKWWVLVTGNNNCTATDTSRINIIHTPPHDFLVSDTLMCLRGEIDIYAPANFQAYRWSNGSASSVLHTENAGIYYLEVTDRSGCEGSDSVRIGTKDCGWGVYVPSAFSPNNDGKNDVLRPVVLGSVKKYVFTVFDRWGTIIYQTKQTDQGWDGMYKNQPANIGAYVWMCEYELKGDEPKIIRGAATLVR